MGCWQGELWGTSLQGAEAEPGPDTAQEAASSHCASCQGTESKWGHLPSVFLLPAAGWLAQE